MRTEQIKVAEDRTRL